MKLSGIFPALATPFDHKGDLYKNKVEHNVSKWNLTGLAGYLVCGSTGETPFMTLEERYQLLEWVAKYAAPDKILLAGTSAESARESIAITNRVAAMGYKAGLVLPPHYYRGIMNKPESQLIFFRTVADQAKMPVLLYNIPQVTGITMTADTVGALAEHPNIVGMKDSSGDLEGTKKFLAAVPKDFQVLTGAAGVVSASLSAGCSGAILAFANAAPYTSIAIWEAFRTREFEAAEDWQQRIQKAAQLIAVTYGVPGLKHAMDLNGYYGGPPRLPLVPVTPQAQQEIAAAFDGLKG